MLLICQEQGTKTPGLKCPESHFFTILKLLQLLQRWSQLLCSLWWCRFASYEFDTMARGDHSKNLFKSIFPKQWKAIEQEAFLSSPFTPIIHGGSSHRPIKLFSLLLQWGKHPCCTEEYGLIVFPQLIGIKQPFYSSFLVMGCVLLPVL